MPATLSRVLTLGAIVLLGVGLTGCSTTFYRKLERSNIPGYAERRQPDGDWEVAFFGAESSKPEVVRDFALLRSAEVTLAQGATHFVLLREVPQRRQMSWNRQVTFGSSSSSSNISMVTGQASGSTTMGSGPGGATVRRGAEYPVMALRIKLHAAGDGPPPTGSYDAANLAREIRAKHGLR